MNQDFFLYYDLARDGFKLEEAIYKIILLFILTIVSTLLSKKFTFFIIPTLGGIVFSIVNIISTYDMNKQYLFYKEKVKNGECQIIEGQISRIKYRLPGYHSKETFYVKEKKFEYSDSIYDVGFHTTVAMGGKLKGGVYVRIYYLDNHILRVEIKR